MRVSTVSDSHPDMPPVLHIDRVEWLSATPDAVLVRVLGRRQGPLGSEPPLLRVGDGDDALAFTAEGAEPATSEPDAIDAENGAWAASFSVPIELRPLLEDRLVLQIGAHQIELPGAVPGAEPDAQEPSSTGLVIDREVLAERRARRAELNEQALISRASAGEATIRTLRSQLSNLEQRLEQTTKERQRLTEALSERERELRRAKQREYAEEQLRFEAEERRRAAEQQATAGVAELRQLLHEAEREIKQLSTEAEDMRRALAEAHHSAEADEASLRRLRLELDERQSELARREGRVSQQEQDVVASMGEAQAAQAEIAQRRIELEQHAQSLEAQVADAQRELAAEQARREMLEHELAARPDAGSDERADALQAELERRARLQAQVAGELSLLHGQLDQVRASAEHQRERNDEADRLLEDLGRTIGGLRVELEGLERDKLAAEASAAQLRAEVSELVRALELARTEPRRDDAQLLLLREQVELRDQQLREAERTIQTLGQSAAELRAELEAERERHGREAAELRARIDEERQTAERRVAGAEARMREQLTAQGERLVLQVDSTHETIEHLTSQLHDATERLTASEHELTQARAAEQAAYDDAQRVAEREAELERVVGELSGTASELRAGFERELANMQQQFADQVAAERDGYLREMAAMEGRVDELRHQLVQAAGELRAELEAEQSARQQAQAELEAEQSVRQQAQAELEAEQSARQQAQAELEVEQSARQQAREQLVGERSEVARLHDALQRAHVPATQTPGSGPIAEPAPPNTPEAEALAEQRRREMAAALAEAVQRLRSRVAARPEQEPDPVSEPPAAEALATRREGATGAPAIDRPEAAPAAEDVEAHPTPAAEDAEAHPAPAERAEPASAARFETAEDADGPETAEDADGPGTGRGGAVAETDPQPPAGDASHADSPPTEDPLRAPVAPAARAAGTPARARRRLAHLFGVRRTEKPRTGPPLTPAPAFTATTAPAFTPATAQPPATPSQVTGPPLPLTLEPPAQAREFELPAVAPAVGTPRPWLAAALRRVASERDAQLAADLIVELMPAQGLHLDRPTSFGVQIADGGLYVVRAGSRQPANVAQAAKVDAAEELDFSISGSAAALSEFVVSGGTRSLSGVEVSGRRRRARRVARARTAPLSFAELANAGIGVWPGLLLLALAEGIDPSWTQGEQFVLAWAIQGTPGALLYTVVGDGQPVGVTHRAPGPPAVAVYVSEQAFLSVMAGTPVAAEERALASGDQRCAQRFIAWARRAQGLEA
jgi:hypothetical protein